MTLIVEDMPIAFALGTWPRQLQNCEYAIHSHNVGTNVFSGIAKESKPVTRKLWEFEIYRIRKAEANCLRSASVIWAITSNDLQEYRRLFSYTCKGVLGVAIDHKRYASVAQGSCRRVIYIGSTDVRKATGLRKFINNSWPAILKRFPDCEFLLAGEGTQAFSSPQSRIRGLGFVEDEREVLGAGAVFVNPQESGSGIKLKSLIAMDAGKALVSTPVGIEGIDGVPGIHFEVGDLDVGVTGAIVRVLHNLDYLGRLSNRGRELVRSHYDLETLLSSTQHLFHDQYASYGISP